MYCEVEVSLSCPVLSCRILVLVVTQHVPLQSRQQQTRVNSPADLRRSCRTAVVLEAAHALGVVVVCAGKEGSSLFEDTEQSAEDDTAP